MEEKPELSSLQQRALRILSEQYSIPVSELLKDPRFTNVMDSLDLVELVMEIEEELDPDA